MTCQNAQSSATDEDNIPSVLVVGIDALDPGQVDVFEESLTVFSSLRDEAVSAPLRSTFPPITGSAWPSMYTGVGPDHHGAFGFFTYDQYPDEFEIITRNEVDAPALWNYLTALDIPSIVLNMPVTYPAEDINGVIVPGYTAPSDASGTPDGIRDELDDAVDGYRIYPDEDRPIPERFIELLDKRERAATYLLTEYEWKLAIIQIQVTDTVFHKTNDRTAHRRVYERADQLLATLLETIDDDVNLVVCSDHGMGRTTGYRIHINDILARRGYLERDAGKSPPSFRTEKQTLKQSSTNEEENDGVFSDIFSRAVSISRRLGINPADVFLAGKKIGAEKLLRRIAPDEAQSDVTWGIDWRASRAYCGMSSEYGIRINLENRESDGIVAEENYESIRSELIADLSEIEDPSGSPAFEFVQRREEVYDGPKAEQAPDILFYPTDDNHNIPTNILGREFISMDAYNHRRDGVFIAHGPSFNEGIDLGPISLTNIAPIVLSLLGKPPSDSMTGKVPEGLLTSSVEAEHYENIEFGARTTTSETDDVRDRLEDLGYM